MAPNFTALCIDGVLLNPMHTALIIRSEMDI